MSKRNDIINSHYRLNYSVLIKRTLRRVPHNSAALAEEVVQEAYARALKYFKTYNVVQDFDTWFNTILRNATNDCRTIETDKGVTRHLDENTQDMRASPEERLRGSSIIQSIEKEKLLIRRNSQRDAIILGLFFIAGFTAKDISEYLSLSHTNVRQVIMIFRDKMNEIYSGNN